MMRAKYGLVLAAGGARGAYQVGVLKRLGEIPRLSGGKSPFPIVAGASAGAINGSAIAAISEDFTKSTRLLAGFWSKLRVDEIFKTDYPSLGRGAGRWLRDLSMGGLIGGGRVQSLLDATPLHEFLAKRLPINGISENIQNGNLYAFAVSATSYFSGKSFTFVQGKKGHPTWAKNRRISLAVQMQVQHITASCAIPILFQPVQISTELGEFYFGDGALRLVSPLSPAIRLGASHVFAIGIRSHDAAEARLKSELLHEAPEGDLPVMKKPPMAQIFGTMLNAIFLDHLDADLDHLRRMNDVLSHYGVKKGDEPTQGLQEPMRLLTPFVIYPSVDLASVAEAHSSRMPKPIRYFLEGLGSSAAQSSDLLSYLLFDSDYTRALIEIGYKDASDQVDRIEKFLSDL